MVIVVSLRIEGLKVYELMGDILPVTVRGLDRSNVEGPFVEGEVLYITGLWSFAEGKADAEFEWGGEKDYVLS